WFNPEEVSIITADGPDVGWIQQTLSSDSVFLGSIYICPTMQWNGIGTHATSGLLDSASTQSKALTLAVMTINPAGSLYKRLGFHSTQAGEYKFYMKAGPKAQ